jgi:hypothetical protein
MRADSVGQGGWRGNRHWRHFAVQKICRAEDRGATFKPKCPRNEAAMDICRYQGQDVLALF